MKQLAAWNTMMTNQERFEIFRDRLEANGLIDQARQFLLASGKLQTLCYKEDIESALRTPGMGGHVLRPGVADRHRSIRALGFLQHHVGDQDCPRLGTLSQARNKGAGDHRLPDRASRFPQGCCLLRPEGGHDALRSGYLSRRCRAMRLAITPNTILLVGSAPVYSQVL
jgi:hypothetical protein